MLKTWDGVFRSEKHPLQNGQNLFERIRGKHALTLTHRGITPLRALAQQRTGEEPGAGVRPNAQFPLEMTCSIIGLRILTK